MTFKLLYGGAFLWLRGPSFYGDTGGHERYRKLGDIDTNYLLYEVPDRGSWDFDLQGEGASAAQCPLRVACRNIEARCVRPRNIGETVTVVDYTCAIYLNEFLIRL